MLIVCTVTESITCASFHFTCVSWALFHGRHLRELRMQWFFQIVFHIPTGAWETGAMGGRGSGYQGSQYLLPSARKCQPLSVSFACDFSFTRRKSLVTENFRTAALLQCAIFHLRRLNNYWWWQNYLWLNQNQDLHLLVS